MKLSQQTTRRLLVMGCLHISNQDMHGGEYNPHAFSSEEAVVSAAHDASNRVKSATQTFGRLLIDPLPLAN